ncbi:hypothetical protein TraAM80_09935 [Trypanosoma rangeli]|uniref:Uncharacterized protein n=1 Tax=Trypanosoma rangeli TaxID=5698 RepID=A0A3R7R562_TRYRA|nr:uncharacterized protein TraAM80_09935 [Trypanosoma rangeli]RNE96159.1 hypothetical protein TraAM80_09935 [Trypanosoma rangeli]|eukprot:RNE96159.1 hypothetical protein TraAM80_09935 [Trypanosoma rangeli]
MRDRAWSTRNLSAGVPANTVSDGTAVACRRGKNRGKGICTRICRRFHYDTHRCQCFSPSQWPRRALLFQYGEARNSALNALRRLTPNHFSVLAAAGDMWPSLY